MESKKIKLKSSCNACIKMHVKCEKNHNSNICELCKKKGKECHFSIRKKSGPKKYSDSSSISSKTLSSKTSSSKGKKKAKLTELPMNNLQNVQFQNLFSNISSIPSNNNTKNKRNTSLSPLRIHNAATKNSNNIQLGEFLSQMDPQPPQPKYSLRDRSKVKKRNRNL